MRYFFLATLIFLLNCQKNPNSLVIYSSYNWETSSPEAQGMNSQSLSFAFEEANNKEFVDGLLVIRNGYIVAEKYYNGFDSNIPHNIMSVSKSFLSALIGIALRDGILTDINQKMLSFFPEHVYPGMDNRKEDITIRHLLMMRAGIDHERNNYLPIYLSNNWIKTTIGLPLINDPGASFHYNTFQTHLLSVILTKASGISTRKFAQNTLFQPMNISVHQWEQDPQGYYFGGNSMHFTPRDMATLGYLYLQNGMFEGIQIVPVDWIEQSLTNYTNFKANSWGDLKNYNYGYLWWLGEMNGYRAFLAIGHGGQFVITFPELDLIIVSTAENNVDWETADQQEREILNIVAQYILSAVKN